MSILVTPFCNSGNAQRRVRFPEPEKNRRRHSLVTCAVGGRSNSVDARWLSTDTISLFRIIGYNIRMDDTVKRKTYSLRGDLSSALGNFSLVFEEETGKVVPRQLILDSLVELMRDDKKVYDKIFSKIKHGQRKSV